MTQRILITGTNGLLGQALIDRLHALQDYDILATSRDDASFHPAQPRHKRLDITDKSSVAEVLDIFEPDIVVNCAAMTQVDACETNRKQCWAVNASAVEGISGLCADRNIHLVHVSTDFVFSGSSGPYREDDSPDPVNYYGEAKLAGEQSIRNSDLNRWTIARTVLVYGTGATLGRSNIALWIIDELSNDHEIQIVTDQWRTPTYVNDLARGIQQIIDRRAEGVYHLSGPELLSVHEFAKRIARVYGFDESLIKPTTSKALGQTARRPPRTGFIIQKATEELDFQPHSIDEALKDLATALDLPTTV